MTRLNATNLTNASKSKVSNFTYPFKAYNFSNDTWAKNRQDVIYKSIEDLKIKDGDDPFSVFPQISFNDGVYLMNDYYNTDYSQMKAYTELEIKIDFFKVIDEALTRTSNWKKDVVSKGGRFEWTDCTTTTPMGYYDLMKNALFKQYTDNQQNYDKRFYINSVAFKKELDDYIDNLS